MNKENIYENTITNLNNINRFLNYENFIYQKTDNIPKLPNYKIDDLVTEEVVVPYFLSSIIKRNYFADKLNAKQVYCYGKYYSDSITRYLYELNKDNNYNYSWDYFCNRYNLDRYKVDNINDKLYYYELKKRVLECLLNNININLNDIKEELLNEISLYEYKEEYSYTGPSMTLEKRIIS